MTQILVPKSSWLKKKELGMRLWFGTSRLAPLNPVMCHSSFACHDGQTRGTDLILFHFTVHCMFLSLCLCFF